jgi:Polyketide synthase dehydratase/Acyl transferase domain
MGIWRKTASRPATGPVNPGLFALRGRDRRALAATLERLALLAPRLSGPERQQLAADWSRRAASGPAPVAASLAGTSPTGASPTGPLLAAASRAGEDGEIRVAFLAEGNDQLVTRARLAADLVSKVQAGPVLSEAGVYLSYAARGRTVLIFPGGGGVPAAEAAALAASVRTLRWLDRCRVSAAAGVGAGLGEIAGLVWAGSLTAAEAARLITQHGELRGGAGLARTALARIPACYSTTTKLAVSCGLFIACYEGPHSHVLGGPAAAVRELARQADSLGLPAEVLAADHALHTPAMAPSVAPLRSVLSQVRFGAPRRRLASTITGRVLTGQEDIAALLCAQLTTPVRFREALGAVADGADLLMLAAPDQALAAAAACSGVPVTSVPASGQDPGACTAALFAAGALPDLAAPAQAAEHGVVTQLAPQRAAQVAAQQAAPVTAQPAARVGEKPAAPAQLAAPAAVHATGPSAAVIPLIRPGATRPGATRPGATRPGATRPGATRPGVPGAASPRGRFVEKITMLRAGEELRAEVRLSLRTDPYLSDYLVDGQPVFPAAMALEAMAQAASTLTQQPMRGAREVSLGNLVGVAADGETLLRVRARVRDGGVETFLHAGSGPQFAECARAVFVGAPASREVAEPGAEAAGDAGPMPPAALVDGVDLYNTVCFQTGRFRRVAIVSGRPPRSCHAIVRGHDDAAWFEQVPEAAGLQELVLGSPGLNDAALQVAQACVPGRVLRPGGCESLAVTGEQMHGAVELRVILISGPATRPVPGDGETELTDYVWDIHGYDGTGQLVIAWTGLRMRDAGPLPSRRNRAAARGQGGQTGPLAAVTESSQAASAASAASA